MNFGSNFCLSVAGAGAGFLRPAPAAVRGAAAVAVAHDVARCLDLLLLLLCEDLLLDALLSLEDEEELSSLEEESLMSSPLEERFSLVL